MRSANDEQWCRVTQEWGWKALIDERNRATRDAGRWRVLRDFDGRGVTGVVAIDNGCGGSRREDVVSFAGNDYLGLSAHPAVLAAAHAATDRWGTGAGASRLVTGTRPIHTELERALADWKGTDAALVFPTGFAANLGVLSTLAGPSVVVYSDERNHASIIDGCRLARAQVQVYRHRDVEHLEELLQQRTGPALVVSETVFSMDGDEAPVPALAAACVRWGALLVLDEAHSVLAPFAGPLPDDVVRLGTLSKTLGSLGGYVVAARPVIDLLVNEARSFMFTTAPTPADAAAALAALGVLRSADGESLIARLRGHVDRVAPGSLSPILPIVMGDEEAAMAAAATLLEFGLLVPAIRPPTVAPGASRLRVTLSAAHTDRDIDRLMVGLGHLEVRDSLGAP